jgi:hypothetical protein
VPKSSAEAQRREEANPPAKPLPANSIRRCEREDAKARHRKAHSKWRTSKNRDRQSLSVNKKWLTTVDAWEKNRQMTVQNVVDVFSVRRLVNIERRRWMWDGPQS